MQIKYYDNEQKGHNILIDCGYAGTFGSTLQNAINELKGNNEKIDLFVLTHPHQDHIGGMNHFINKYGQDDLVNQYWFNGGKFLINIPNSNMVSIDQGFELDKLLINTKRSNAEKIVYGTDIVDIYGATIKVIGPSKTVLEQFLEKYREYDYGVSVDKITTEVCDWNIDIEEFDLDQYDADDSDENQTSISFILNIKGKSIMFLGDSHANDIAQNLMDMKYTKVNRLHIDYMKISHHASRGNTSDELLDLVCCNKFIISTNGTNRDKFPHKEVFARILRHPLRNIKKKITFIFNYDTPEIRSIFKEHEYIKYNFECIYPREGENNVAIYL